MQATAPQYKSRRGYGVAAAIYLLAATGASGCVEAEFDDATQDDHEDDGFRYDEYEPGDLVVEFADLAAYAGKPLWPECPACAEVVARSANHIDVFLQIPGDHGYTAVLLRVDQPGLIPTTVSLPSPRDAMRGSVRLRSPITLRDDAGLSVSGLP